MVGGLANEVFSSFLVPGRVPAYGQAVQAVGTAVGSGFLGQVLGTLPVPGALSHQRQTGQGIDVAAVGDLLKEGLRPFPIPSLLQHHIGLGEASVGVPERGGRTQSASGAAAVLFEVVSEPEHRQRRR